MVSQPVVLCVNGGSSSVKVALFRLAPGNEIELAGEVVEGHDADQGIKTALDRLQSRRLPAPDAIGHRLVHGGPHHQRPQRIDAPLLASLRLAVKLRQDAHLVTDEEFERLRQLCEERARVQIGATPALSSQFGGRGPDPALQDNATGGGGN